MPLSIGRRFAILVGGMGNTSKSPLSHPSRKHEGCESLSIGCFPLPFGGCRGRKRVGKCRKTGFPPPFQPKKRGKRRGNSSKCLFSHPSSKSGGCEPARMWRFPLLGVWKGEMDAKMFGRCLCCRSVLKSQVHPGTAGQCVTGYFVTKSSCYVLIFHFPRSV